MQGSGDYLQGLVQLHRLSSEDERRTTWRQSMATLAHLVAESPVLPLEGHDPEALLESLRVALAAGLVDDLGWLSEAGGGLALFEIASALPDGPERRELGRRVLERLTEGDATTFVALATRLALGPSRVLSGAPLRARVALTLDLPLGRGVRADALALALISRRDLERDWLAAPATGSLPSRRLAAKLLERAAREAVRRAAGGDDSGLRVFDGPTVRAAWERLLGDREPLVWRHVAAARGLLASMVPPLFDEVGRHLDPALSPTEWRRAAASVAAMIAFRPEAALARGRRIVAGPLLKLDRGVAAALILGLPRAAESEPDAAEELLETCVAFGSVDAYEALVDLGREGIGEDFGLAAAKLAQAGIRDILSHGSSRERDDGLAALLEALLGDLEPGPDRADPSLRDHLLAALSAFAEHGARAAHAETERALSAAEGALRRLEGFREELPIGRRRAFRALRELDAGLLETSTLADLLLLGAKGEAAATAPLGALLERLAALLIEAEGTPLAQDGRVPHRTVRLRRLRAMLHLADAEAGFTSERPGAHGDVRLAMARTLLRRARDDAPSPLDRTVCAAAARACDALAREEVLELSDVFVAAAFHLLRSSQQETMAEASMVPEIEAVVRAYAELLRRVEKRESAREVLRALYGVALALPIASSRRVEALRAALLAFARSLETAASARSLGELVEGADPSPMAEVEASTRSLALLCAGARRRFGLGPPAPPPSSPAAIRLVDIGLERALRGAPGALREALATAADLLAEELPPALAGAAASALSGLASLPAEATRGAASEPPLPRLSLPEAAPLPSWLPPSRILGGFYVLRALGAGAAASVFAVRRVEERYDDGAETFALKVPAYDGSAARALTEAQFLQMFRDEAGALLAVPHHPNLARFVTFDAGAKPKPVLVMELVEGATLERVVALGGLDVAAALALVDGVAAGLEAMHSVGVGHLDLKPSNVILRDRDGRGPAKPAAVLVDFGLSGRAIRPGCGTPHYAAPEIWGVLPDGWTPTPMAADVYALGAIAFEVLTGRTLFDAASVEELKALHLGHDGRPPACAALGEAGETRGLAALLEATLRRDPRGRPPSRTFRAALEELAPSLAGLPWPLAR